MLGPSRYDGNYILMGLIRLEFLWILRNGFQIRFLMGLIHLETVYPWLPSDR